VDIVNAMKKMSFPPAISPMLPIFTTDAQRKKMRNYLNFGPFYLCCRLYADLRDMVKNNMIDAIVATGASIVDMDFFEALVSSIIKARHLLTINYCVNFISTGFTTPSLMKNNYRPAIKQLN